MDNKGVGLGNETTQAYGPNKGHVHTKHGSVMIQPQD